MCEQGITTNVVPLPEGLTASLFGDVYRLEGPDGLKASVPFPPAPKGINWWRVEIAAAIEEATNPKN